MVLGAKSTINHFARVQDQLNFVAFWIHWVPQGPMLLIPSRWIFYYFARLLQEAHPAKKRGSQHSLPARRHTDTWIHAAKVPIKASNRFGSERSKKRSIWPKPATDLGKVHPAHKKRPWRVPVKRMFLGAKFWSEKNVPTRAVVGMLWGSKASWGKHCSFPTKDSKINRNHPSRYPGTQTATWALGQLYYKVKVLVARTNSRRGGAEKLPSTSNLGKYLEFFRRLGCFDRYVMQYWSAIWQVQHILCDSWGSVHPGWCRKSVINIRYRSKTTSNRSHWLCMELCWRFSVASDESLFMNQNQHCTRRMVEWGHEFDKLQEPNCELSDFPCTCVYLTLQQPKRILSL